MKKYLVALIGVPLIGLALAVGLHVADLTAQPAFAASEGGFDTTQITASAAGETTDFRTFELDISRRLELPNSNGKASLEWEIEVFVDGIGEFDGSVSPSDIRININTGHASVDTVIIGCGAVNVTWKATGEEFRNDNSFKDGLGGDVRTVQHFKLTDDVTGTMCGKTIGTLDDTDTAISQVHEKCRGFSEAECDFFLDEFENFPLPPGL